MGSAGKIMYNFEKEGVTNGVPVSGINEFLSEDFDSVWETKRALAPIIHLDSKDLLNYAKHDRESRMEHKQYS